LWNPEHHELALEDIDHTRTKTQSFQTNGICERFHKTVLNEFYRVTFRKKLYNTIDELQADLDQWLKPYNRTATPSKPMVLRQDTDANLYRQRAPGQGEDVGGVSGGSNQ
jgi:transposase InsO family protein